jgi:basic amino acid/polyamine antiporter, APA family
VPNPRRPEFGTAQPCPTIPPVTHRPARSLLTVLGVTFGLAVTIGNVIGAGILRTPGDIAANLPTFWPFLSVWIIGALYAMLGANALAELAAATPRSGGQYVFVRRALGDYPAFIVGWSDWISTCGTTAVVSITLGEYAVVLLPHLPPAKVIALIVVAVLTVVQWMGVRSGAMTQDITSVLKAVALLALIVACFWLGGRNPAAPGLVMERESSLLVAFVLALQAVIYTYDGWTAPIYFAGEVKNPGRDIPRSMFGGLALVTAIYLLINVAFVRVVPLATIAGEKLAAATVARFLFGPNGDLVVRSIVVIALLSAANSNVMIAPRVIYAMAKDRLFWRGATEVNEGGTPDISLLISSAIAAAFIVTGQFETVLAKIAYFFVANYTLSFISLFVMRMREPNAERPYRAFGHPVTTAIALLASIVFLIGAVMGDPGNSLWAVGLLLISYPAYLLVRPKTA